MILYEDHPQKTMPALNVIKDYIKDGCYHIFNRGVDKRQIFLDEQDYRVFLHYLKRYLTPPPPTPSDPTKDHPSRGSSSTRMILSKLWEEINLLAYCLMPNHFHLLVKQITKDAMTRLMRKLPISYCLYFNKKYKRSGHLFQGIYKGILITSEDGLLNVANYIHLNPTELLPENLSDEETLKKLIDYPYSSLGNYLGERKSSWVKTEEILKIVGSRKNYRKLLYKPLDLPISFEDYLASLKDDPSRG